MASALDPVAEVLRSKTSLTKSQGAGPKSHSDRLTEFLSLFVNHSFAFSLNNEMS